MLVHRAHAHLSPFRQLSAELDRMFESLFTPSGAQRGASFAAVDLSETDDAFHLEAELPGVRADEGAQVQGVSPIWSGAALTGCQATDLLDGRVGGGVGAIVRRRL